MEPLRNVLSRRVDRIEWRHVVDAAVIEFLRQVLEFLSGADEIDRDRVTVDATTPRREFCRDLVRMSVQRLRDTAIFAQVVCGFEASFHPDRETAGETRFAVRGPWFAV